MTDAKATVLAFALSFGLYAGYGVRLVLAYRAVKPPPPPAEGPPPPPGPPESGGARCATQAVQTEVKPRPAVRV